jgi:monoamine oxidase
MIKEVPFWWATAPELPGYADKPLPQRADVVVIGSGYTGLSAARSLAQQGANVVVLEKETIGWGASSRNGGQVLTGLAVGPEALIKQVGLERAKELHAASLRGLDFIEQLIRTEQISAWVISRRPANRLILSIFSMRRNCWRASLTTRFGCWIARSSARSWARTPITAC